MPNENNVPVLQSYDQYLGDLLAAYLSGTGINDLNVGSAVTSFFETVALTTARASGDAIQILKDNSVDRATSDSLQRIAADENLRLVSAKVASGNITIVDTSFTKKSTKIYSGQSAPNIGSTIIYVSDASLFTATGSVYLGRGTSNSEGPLAYISKVEQGSYWVLTLNPANPTTRYHNNNESVILAQGGVRTIPVNTVVQAPASGASAEVNFSVSPQAIILDGETTVTGVQVACSEIGLQGNAPAGAIKLFVNPPSANLTVTNPLPFTDGRSTETDDQLRARIKLARQSIGLGTATAIKASVIGASPVDESETVVADSIITAAGVTTLYIDNGATYEEKNAGVGIEDLVDSAYGGERNFQLQCGGRQTSITKAYLQTSLLSPFALFGGENLSVVVGGIVSTHAFSSSNFLSAGGATAYEVVSSINADNPLLYEATTASGGTKVVIKAKAESFDYIEISPTTGVDAAPILGFPSNLAETLRLYKNDELLIKDGFLAEIVGNPQADWSSAIVTGDTVILAVDGTPSVTYIITNQDFINEGTYSTVSSSNSLQSWINVFNSRIAGVTASQLGSSIQFTSNRGFSDQASVQVSVSSTLVTKGLFDNEDLFAQGRTSDYTLSRNTAQITLTEPLVAGDSLSAGIFQTEATVIGSLISGGIVNIGSTAGSLSQSLWIVADDLNAEVIAGNIVGNAVITVSKPVANTIRYETGLGNFSNILMGDYVILWSYELDLTNRFEARVSAVDATFNWFEITVTAAEFTAAVTGAQSPYQAGITFIRTSNVPERFRLPAGTIATLSAAAALLNSETYGVNFSVIDNTYLTVTTLTRSISGSILIAAVASNMGPLGFLTGQKAENTESLVAFYQSDYEDGEYPAFIHSNFITLGAVASPPVSYIDGVNQMTSAINLSTLDLHPNYTIGMLEPYGAILDTLSPNEQTFLNDYLASGLTLEDDIFVKRLRVASLGGGADRFYIAEPLSFGPADKLVVVLDNDAVNKTFVMPMYRGAATNSGVPSSTTQFNAYDSENSPTSPFSGTGGQFPADFSFNNFKVLMQAKEVLKQTVPSVDETAILFRAVQWDQSGEYVNVGYTYPSTANAAISSVSSVSDNVEILISLKSGPLDVTPGLLPTTRWTVTRSSNTPVVGTDRLTYTYSSGSAPTLPALVGHYVNIPTASELSLINDGIYLVTASGVTSFSVDRTTGDGQEEFDREGGAIIFYGAVDTTAAEIVTYVTSTVSVSSVVSATLVNDNGTSGAGIISRSTYDGSAFAYYTLYLKDGVNWILSSDLDAISPVPQFILKRPLALISAVGYNFFAAEPLKLVPTDVNQVNELSNILAVSGITSVGTVSLSDNTKKIELATNILGGQGAVQIVGGTANSASGSVLNTSQVVDNQFINTYIGNPNLLGFTSNQLVKLTAQNKQNKSMLLAGDELVTITPNSPIAGYSSVTLGVSSSITERRFGIQRTNQRTRGRSFKIEKQGLLSCLSWDGISGTSPLFSTTAEIDFTVGDTVYVEKVGSSANYVITGTTNFTEVDIGDLVTIASMPESNNNGTFLVTGVSDDGQILQVANPLATDQFPSGSFELTANIQTGDTFTINATVLVADTDFAVGGTVAESAQSLSVAIGLIAGVTSTYGVSLANPFVYVEGNAGASTFAIAASEDTIRVDVLPASGFLANFEFVASDFVIEKAIQEGDTMSIRASSNISIPSFSVQNLGDFRVIRRFGNSLYYYNANTLEETLTIQDDFIYNGAGADFNATNVDNYLVLEYLSGATDPTDQAAAQIVSVGDEVILGAGNFPSNTGSYIIVGIDTATSSLILMNPEAVTESNPVTVTGTNMRIHRNTITCTEYNATNDGDVLSISSNFLTQANRGIWGVSRVLSKNTIMIQQVLAASSVTLAQNTSNFNVIESTAYVGYKKTLLVTTNPNSNQEGVLVFDTRYQADKINAIANIVVAPTNKMGFNTVIKYGIDSYQYNTGLLAECNRIVYGDPRDVLTYPGVAAAGAEIYIKPPLDRRVSMSIDVAINTGVSFANMVQRVRTGVASVINSNPIGSPIAISSIISAVNSIPGVRAVAISSPLYNALNSTIFIGPAEKARILNLNDISVSAI